VTALADLETVNQPTVVGPPRDRYGRYLIPDPDTGRPRPWTRATTIAKTLEDPTNLTLWKGRMAAIGVATRPSIAAGIVAHLNDKQQLNKLVDEAINAAGGNENRELGTHLHDITAQIDRGDHVNVPEPWATDVAAYQRALDAHGLTVDPQWVEVVLLNRPLEIAGTADRLYRDHENQLVVADLKTGGYLAWLSFAMQFSIYATATHWFDPATGELHEMPEVRQDHALLVHLPAGEGRCRIEPLSVEVGYDATLMALEVRRVRALDKEPRVKAATWHPPITEVAPKSKPPVMSRQKMREELVARIGWLRQNAPDVLEIVAARWPAGVPTLRESIGHTDAQLAAIRDVLDDVETPF
jgi:hypothetical protein